MDLIFKKYSQGSTANIYKKNGIVLKQYYYYSEPKYLITEELFDTLKEIDSPNILRLIKLVKSHDVIEGYKYHYVERDDIKIVYENNSYTIDNVNDLLKLIDKFNYLRILINDALCCNIITQKNRLVIIDPDSYNIDYKKTYDEVSLHNKKQLLEYIKSLYLSCFLGHSKDYYDAINLLFNFSIDKDTDIAYELSKRLIYKKPIETIDKIKRSI